MTSHIHSNTQTEWRSPVPASKREEEYDYHHGLWYQQRCETHCFTCQRRRPEVVYTTRKPAKNNGDQRRECQVCLCSCNQSYLYFWWISVSLKTMLIDISTSLLTICLSFCLVSGGPGSGKGRIVANLRSMFGMKLVSGETLIFKYLPKKVQHAMTLNDTCDIAELVRKDPSHVQVYTEQPCCVQLCIFSNLE